MKEFSHTISDESQLPAIAESLLPWLEQRKIITFSGNLGAGKTTLIKHLCRTLHSSDEISSPTYSIVNEYHTKKKEVIYHMDWYRLESVEEALNAGIEEYLYSGHYCFIEWPEKAAELLPEEIIKIEMEKISHNERKITIFIL
jgi:tRNA threonylcarbamoyladenosine biosynthesis protein TsaE